MTTKQLIRYLAMTFALGWFFQYLAGANDLAAGGRSWLIAAMWAPALAAVLNDGNTRRLLWMRCKRAGWKFWPLALLIGWSFSAGQQLLLLFSQQGHWHSDMFRLSTDQASIESIHRIAVLLGVGQQSFGFFALNILLTVTVASLITMLIGGVGEEAGWRGILQPEFERRYGDLKGTVLVGLIWGYWHLPANLAGLNDSQHPLAQAFLIFPLETVAVAFPLAWLVKRTGSIWPAALAHAANNVLSSGVLIVANNWIAEQLTSVLATVAIGVLFVWLIVVKGKDVASTDSGSLGSHSVLRASGTPGH